MVDFKAVVVLTIASLARAASVAQMLDTVAECGDGACQTGTECATEPSLCAASDVTDGGNDTAVAYTEVIGYGRPVVPAGYVPTSTQVGVWQGCTDLNFSGACVVYDYGCNDCNGCYQLEGIFVNSLSSIKMLVPNMGCDFWVTSDCTGVGISMMNSGQIPDLATTTYNDRIVAFHCFTLS